MCTTRASHGGCRDLPKADAIIFGVPTRFGTAPTQVWPAARCSALIMSPARVAQIKTLLDSTGQLWQSGALVR